jgi:hypothetical protein
MKSRTAVTNNKAAEPIPAPIPAFAPVLRPVLDEDILAARSAPVLRPVPDEDVLASRDDVVEVNVAAESVEGVLLDEAPLDEVSFDKVESDDAGPGTDVETLAVGARAST